VPIKDGVTSSGVQPVADTLVRVEQLLVDGHEARALALLSAAIERDPQPELLALRAELTMAGAVDAPGDTLGEQIEWLASPAGQQSTAIGRERALADLEAALASRDSVEWRLLRADLLLEAGRWEEAEAAFADARARVDTLPPEEREGASERAALGIEWARRGPEGGEQLLDALQDQAALASELDADSSLLSDVTEARQVIAELDERAEQTRAAPGAGSDALRERAQSVARTLAELHADTPERYAPFDADELDRAARAFYDSALAALERLGYELCGDVEPLRNTERSGTRTLVRVALSPDRLTAAAIWRLVGPHSRYEVTELESVLADGSVVRTNDQGTTNPFEQPPQIMQLSLPPGTDAATLVAVHRDRLAEAPSPPAPLPDLDAVLAAEERQRMVKHEFARSRGFVSDAELRGLLGASFDELAGLVREELARLLDAPESPPPHP
jgi:hypothetical protein